LGDTSLFVGVDLFKEAMGREEFSIKDFANKQKVVYDLKQFEISS